MGAIWRRRRRAGERRGKAEGRKSPVSRPMGEERGGFIPPMPRPPRHPAPPVVVIIFVLLPDKSST